jgi:hypothetical protein
VADGIDAVVHSVQPTRPGPAPNRFGAEPEDNELGKSDDPVLPFRKGGDRSLQIAASSPSGRFRTYSGRNRPLASHGADRPAAHVTLQHPGVTTRRRACYE